MQISTRSDQCKGSNASAETSPPGDVAPKIARLWRGVIGETEFQLAPRSKANLVLCALIRTLGCYVVVCDGSRLFEGV